MFTQLGLKQAVPRKHRLTKRISEDTRLERAMLARGNFPIYLVVLATLLPKASSSRAEVGTERFIVFQTTEPRAYWSVHRCRRTAYADLRRGMRREAAVVANERHGKLLDLPADWNAKKKFPAFIDDLYELYKNLTGESLDNFLDFSVTKHYVTAPD